MKNHIDLESEEFKDYVKRMRQFYPSFGAKDFVFDDRSKDIECAEGQIVEKRKPKKKSPRKASKEIKEHIKCRDGFKCTLCGETEGLEVHHIKYRSEGGDNSDNNLVTLCRRCHALQHEGEPVFNLMIKNVPELSI